MTFFAYFGSSIKNIKAWWHSIACRGTGFFISNVTEWALLARFVSRRSHFYWKSSFAAFSAGWFRISAFENQTICSRDAIDTDGFLFSTNFRTPFSFWAPFAVAVVRSFKFRKCTTGTIFTPFRKILCLLFYTKCSSWTRWTHIIPYYSVWRRYVVGVIPQWTLLATLWVLFIRIPTGCTLDTISYWWCILVRTCEIKRTKN